MSAYHLLMITLWKPQALLENPRVAASRLDHSFIRNCESVCRCLTKGAPRKANTDTRHLVVVQEAGSYCRFETELVIVL